MLQMLSFGVGEIWINISLSIIDDLGWFKFSKRFLSNRAIKNVFNPFHIVLNTAIFFVQTRKPGTSQGSLLPRYLGHNWVFLRVWQLVVKVPWLYGEREHSVHCRMLTASLASAHWMPLHLPAPVVTTKECLQILQLSPWGSLPQRHPSLPVFECTWMFQENPLTGRRKRNISRLRPATPVPFFFPEHSPPFLDSLLVIPKPMHRNKQLAMGVT